MPFFLSFILHNPLNREDSLKKISAADLKYWSQTSETSSGELPELLRRLITNSVGMDNIECLELPSGRSVSIKKGFDGTVRLRKNTPIFKADATYKIECGQNNDTKDKFKEDFKKRTDNLKGEKLDGVFVFVSAAWQCSNRSEVIEQIKNEIDPNCLWNDVIIIDADDLENLLDNDYATTAWLLNKMGKPHTGFDGADFFWDNWLASTRIPLDESVILARNDFNDTPNKIISWISSPTGILYISSEGRQEDILYFIATIKSSELSKEIKDSILSRICIIYDEAVWKEIIQTKSSKNLILIPDFKNPTSLAFAKKENMNIVCPLKNSDLSLINKQKKEEVLRLEELNLSRVKSVLSKRENNNLSTLATFNGKSLLGLQRELALEAIPEPEWWNHEQKDLLFRLAMVGKWGESNNTDCSFLSDFCNKPLNEIEKIINEFLLKEEAPIEKRDGIFNVVYQRLILESANACLGIDDFKKTIHILLSVFKEHDQIFDLDSEKRFWEVLQNKSFSNELKEGIAKGLACIANIANETQKNIIDYEISNILGTDWKKMASIEPYFSILVEASPNVCLTWFENELNIEKNNPLVELYNNTEYDHPFLCGFTSYTGFLFGLEKLAWKRIYFKRVVNALLRWAFLAKDLKTGISNSPIDSLSKLFRPFLPQTEISYTEIYAILGDLKSKKENHDLLFEILYQLIPTDRRTIIGYSERPFYMKTEEVLPEQKGNMSNYMKLLFEYVVGLAEYIPERWEKLLSHIYIYFEKELLHKISQINFLERSIPFKAVLRKSLQKNKDWWEKYGNEAKKEDAITDYKNVLNKIPETESILEYVYVFSRFYANISRNDKIDELQEAVEKIYKKYGFSGIIELSKEKNVNLYNLANQTSLFLHKKKEELIDGLILSVSNNAPSRFIACLANQISSENGYCWLDRIELSKFSDDYLRTILLEIPPTIKFFYWLDKKKIADQYWPFVHSLFLNNQEEYNFAYERLSKIKNYSPLLNLMSRKDVPFVIKNEEKIDVLLNVNPTVNEAYSVSLIMEDLRQSPNIPIEMLVPIEIKFIDKERSLSPILRRYIADNPLFVVSLIDQIYKKDEKEKIVYKKTDKNWGEILIKVYVHLQETFLFDSSDQMILWIKMVLNDLEKIGKREFGEHIIGYILANAPEDPEDKVWPIKYVRDYIENEATQVMRKCLLCEKSNYIACADAGEPCMELIELGEKYGRDSLALEVEYPNMASVLKELELFFKQAGKRYSYF